MDKNKIIFILIAIAFIGASLFVAKKIADRDKLNLQTGGAGKGEQEAKRDPVPGDIDYVLPPEVDYRPVPNASFEYPEFRGDCQFGSVYSSRKDVYTCVAGENKFDLCFMLEAEGALLCGIDPENDQTGAIFKATNALTTAKAIQSPGQNQFFLIKLEDGSKCYPVGDLDLMVAGKQAKYKCFEEKPTAIFDEPAGTAGDRTVEIATLAQDEETHAWSIESVRTEKVSNVWR
jgi:hypothetical protein